MAKIYRKRGNKLNEVVTFDSACTRQENQPLVYDATDGSVHTTTHIGCLDADDVSVNNLTVTGQAIIQEQVTDTIGSNTLVLRSNAEAGLAGSENSGLIIHNYNGSADLYAVTDNTGTFRVGTAVSTTTTYPYLRYNEVDNKWYSTAPEVTPAVEVTPVGSPTSWDSVVTSGDDVEYTNIVFSVIDRTSLEPLTTRDESTDMEEGYLTKWDATDEKVVTTGTSCTHDLCANGNITSTGDITSDGNVCVKTNITVDGNSCLKGNSTIDGNSCVKGTSTVTGEIHSCDCITTPTACISDDIYVDGDINNCNTNSVIHGYNGCFENNFCIKGDLSVDGFATISGLMSDYVATTEDTTTNDWEYLTFVPTNHLTKGRNPVYTDGDLKYNPYSNTLYMGNACVTDTACITCACIGDECVNNLCIGTIVTNANATESATYCVSSITGNTDYIIPLYNKDITNLNTDKTAKLSYTNSACSPRYNPNTNTFCAYDMRACRFVAADTALVSPIIYSGFDADVAAGGHKDLQLIPFCKDANGNVTGFSTKICGTDGKIYNNYGVCSTAQINGLNTPVTTSLYSEDLGSGYIYLGCASSIASTGNHDITLSGTAYIYWSDIIETTKFSVTLRGNDTNLGLERLYVDNKNTKLKFTYEVNGNVYTIRAYYQLSNAWTRATLKIDYAGNGDEGTQVPPASVWQPNTGTVVVNAMTGTEIYKRVFPGSCVAYASCAGELQDHYNDGFSAYLYNGELSGVCKFNNNICLYDGNYNSFCALEAFSCVGVLCQGLGTYQYPSRWLTCTSSSRSIGIFNPALDINERGYIPTIPSMNAVDSNYKILGFSLGAYRGRCEFEGAYFGVYRPYNYGGTVGCNCLRAVMNWHNCVCSSCTTEAGTWMCDSMIELIDTQGCQTINGTLSATTFCGNFCGAVTGKATNLDASGADIYPVGTCSARLWSSSTTDSYGVCPGDWAHYLSMSHGDYDTYYGLSLAMPFWEDNSARFRWRVRNQGTLWPVHELIDNRGGQTINGTLDIDGIVTSGIRFQTATASGVPLGTNYPGFVASSYITNVGYNGGAYIGHLSTNYDQYWGFATFGFYNFEDETICSAICVDRFSNLFTDGSITGSVLCGSNSSGLTVHNTTTLGQVYLGSTSVAIGHGILWQGENCCNVVIGYESCAWCQDTVAIGRCVSAFNYNAVAIGAVTNANCSAVAIGAGTNASCYGIALGNQAYANARSFAVGSFACACGEDTIAIGASARARSSNSIAIGCGSMALGDGAVSIGSNATACTGFLALGTCATSDVDIDTTIAGNPMFPYSSIIEIDDIKYGRHGRIKFVIPSCSRDIDITSFFNKLFINVINNGRCENTWSTSSFENIPTLVAHLSGFYWDDGGSSDGYQRWAPGVNGRGNINELILLNTSAGASSNLSVCDLIVTCGKNVITTSWNWGTGTNVWTCGMVGTIEF